MLNLLRRDILLTRLLCISFILAASINFDGNRWFPIYTAYQAFSNVYLSITPVADIIIGSRELNDIVASISTTAAGMMALFKLFLFVTKTKEIKSILKRLETIYSKMLEDENSRHDILEAENFGRKMSAGFVLVFDMIFPIIAFIIVVIADIIANFKDKHLVLKVWIPWSRENLWIQILTNAWLTSVTIACLSIYAAFFSLELTFSLYVAAYTKQLEQKLIKNGIKNQEIYEQHKVIMQLIIDFNDVLSGQMYIEAVISPLMPCGFALAAIKGIQKNDINQSFHNGFRTLLSFLPCTISCYCGQLILTQMESLHETSYMTNWYEEEPKIRKDLLIMMAKTTNTTTINYRLFVKFDFVLLSAVLQVIYSYFTLMLNLDEG